MLLRPKKTKYKKYHRGKHKISESKFNLLKHGMYGMLAQESAFLTSNQIESCRQVINRHLKRKGKIWISVFPFLSRTSKPTEVRMGKGKGNLRDWVSRVFPGKILFEVDGVSLQKAHNALTFAKKKLPLKVFLVKNNLKKDFKS